MHNKTHRIEALETRRLLATAPFNSDLFGGYGFLKLQSPSTSDVDHIVAQPDGKFIVSRFGSTPLQRYTSSFALDSSFVADPWVKQHGDVPDLTVLANGSMMYSDGAYVVRLTSSGKLDTALGRSGHVKLQSALFVAFPDGRFVTANGNQIRRYHADGSPDTSFGSNGLVKAPADSSHVRDLDVQSNGGIIVTIGYGQPEIDPESGGEVIRLTSKGSVDQSFGIDLSNPEDNAGIQYNSESAVDSSIIGPHDEVYVFNNDVDGDVSIDNYDQHGNQGLFVSPPGFGTLPKFGFTADGHIIALSTEYDFNFDRTDFHVSTTSLSGVGDFNTTIKSEFGQEASDLAVLSSGKVGIVIEGGVLLYRMRGKAGSIGLQDNSVQVWGTTSADTVTASIAGDVLHVKLNGTDHTFTTKDVQSIELHADAGDDSINLGSTPINATIFGEAGNDTLTGGAGDDTLDGGTGADAMNGGGGKDTADYRDRTESLSLSLDGIANDGASNEHDNLNAKDIEGILGGSGAASIVGSAHDDRLVGNSRSDTLVGLAGNDTLYGNDCDGGTGNDKIAGSPPYAAGAVTPVGILRYNSRTANDSLSYDGSDSTSTIMHVGSSEQDDLPGGFNELIGGPGNDQILNVTDYGYVSPTVLGEGGNDVIRMASSTHGNGALFNGGDGNDQLIGASTVIGGPGADRFGGGSTVSYAPRTTDQHIDLSNPKKINAEGDSIIGIVSSVITGSGNDTIIGSAIGEVLATGAGNDSIEAGAGNDTCNGGDGDDTIDGQAGNDFLNGGLGSDLIDGGTGHDWAAYGDRTEDLHITLDGLRNDGAVGENDQLLSIENVAGGEGSNYIVGNSGDNFISCQSGEDTGRNTLIGGAGNDTLLAGPNGDLLRGGDGDDSLVGLDGNDTLWGDAGNDTMLGNRGDDELHAKDGAIDSVNGGNGGFLEDDNDKASVDRSKSISDEVLNIEEVV